MMFDPKDEAIHGRAFLQHLEDIGILHKGSAVRRVIIDAAYDSAIFVYVERLGTQRLLELQSPDVMGMQVVMVTQDEEEGDGEAE